MGGLVIRSHATQKTASHKWLGYLDVAVQQVSGTEIWGTRLANVFSKSAFRKIYI